MNLHNLALGALVLSATLGTAQAQTKSGTLLLSGNINYSSTTSSSKPVGLPFNPMLNSETTQQQLGFTPQAGYFVADNLVLGLSLTGVSSRQFESQGYYANNTQNTYLTATREVKDKGMAYGPFVRYYHMVGDKAGFFGQLTAARLTSTSVTTYNPAYQGFTSYEQKETGGFGSLTPGFVYFPTAKFGLELTLGSLSYLASTIKPQNLATGQPNSETKRSTFEAGFGLQYLTVGAAFHLGK
jgi:hypothetical protein